MEYISNLFEDPKNNITYSIDNNYIFSLIPVTNHEVTN